MAWIPLWWRSVHCLNTSVHHSGHSGITVAVCPNGYGGYRPDANGRSAAIATEIDRQGQMIFGGKGDREFFLRTDRYDGASVKPVFLCSDAHRMEDIGGRYTG